MDGRDVLVLYGSQFDDEYKIQPFEELSELLLVSGMVEEETYILQGINSNLDPLL
ncbi:MAG: hypothetical protein XU11_C0028G0029 [Candidatus Dadabacteria bacterium CSP1-2]|nr:MAG: hypothetical protein XU11_C0028G0029 [Candidatus Dadabacteria bacterium CSP1-2]